MDELERAGRALRESVAHTTQPSDRLRERARTIVRRHRMIAAGSIATAVIIVCIGIALAANGTNGVGVHTIPPAGTSTTHTSLPPSPTVATAPAPHLTLQTGQVLPQIAFVDAEHGWRAAPEVGGKAIEFTSDGGRTWTTQATVPANNHDTNSIEGVVAVDRSHAFALAYPGYTAQGAALPTFLMRTTDGIQWARVTTAGLAAPLFTIAFADPMHGWGITERGRLVTTADGGSTWHVMTRPTSGGIGAVCLGAPGSGWVATDSAVYGSVDNGTTWKREFVMPYGGEPALICRGSHVAFAGFGQGAGQSIGGFVRSDDGGAHWRPLKEDAVTGPPATAPGFPDAQFGYPTAMTADGTLVFTTACEQCSPIEHSVVVSSAQGRFVVGHFDDTVTGTPPLELIDATAPDRTHVFAEVRRLDANSPTGGSIALYASSDGGHTWRLRRTDG